MIFKLYLISCSRRASSSRDLEEKGPRFQARGGQEPGQSQKTPEAFCVFFLYSFSFL